MVTLARQSAAATTSANQKRADQGEARGLPPPQASSYAARASARVRNRLIAFRGR